MSVSPQDLLATEHGTFGGDRISSTIGNTGWVGTGALRASPDQNVFTGNYRSLEVFSASTLTDETVSNINGITGFSLAAGTYRGIFSKIQLSGGDILAHLGPRLSD